MLEDALIKFATCITFECYFVHFFYYSYLSRRPSSFSAIKPLYRPYQQQNQIKHLGRRSKQAQMKVEKMKKAFKMAKEKNASKVTVSRTCTESIVLDIIQTVSNSTCINRVFLIYKFKAETPLVYTWVPLGNT